MDDFVFIPIDVPSVVSRMDRQMDRLHHHMKSMVEHKDLERLWLPSRGWNVGSLDFLQDVYEPDENGQASLLANWMRYHRNRSITITISRSVIPFQHKLMAFIHLGICHKWNLPFILWTMMYWNPLYYFTSPPMAPSITMLCTVKTVSYPHYLTCVTKCMAHQVLGTPFTVGGTYISVVCSVIDLHESGDVRPS